ncbi:serine/threonine protein kinase [Acinetobacter baumannii]|uniref:serine/threonine protein kinase n=1 Tax=Acinetobacter baumannii TaxID=470 RepID=UPI0020BED8E5|nr:serine/threonine-protein kinase [Acinetobacter baumannii]MCL6185161.1 serine/threonine protein kinase [Acinetobacter baumannii]MCL6192046.1 serine/threonine protein kinase [Acinetobacter baumannii]HEM7759313.1 serine/threonine protein kinase [Acinetobacter baumannii]
MLFRGNYKIEPIEEMGGGSFGEVQKVRVYNQKDHLCGIFALKTMQSTAREIDDFRKRFKREGYLQSKCCHPNIVSLYICDLDNDEPWFVMELGDKDVGKLILEGLFPKEEKLKCILHLLFGMAHIHGLKLLHRDIKPSNMVRVGGVYKIVDFGLVKNTEPNPGSTQLTAIGQVMGTKGFAAPEVAIGHYDYLTDIYAIGTFIEQVCYGDEQLASALLPIINKCRERIPTQRFQSIEQILDAFMPIYEEGKNA